MSGLNWDKQNRAARAASYGTETNTMLPGGEPTEDGNVDPTYKRKPTVFKKIAKRMSKVSKKRSPSKKFEDKVKPFVVEVRRPKKVGGKNPT